MVFPNELKNVISRRRRLYVKKHRSYYFDSYYFPTDVPIVPMAATTIVPMAAMLDTVVYFDKIKFKKMQNKLKVLFPIIVLF